MGVVHGTPNVTDGPVLTVRFRLTQGAAALRRRSGNPVPPPAEVVALIDTGAEVTCLDPSVIARLGVSPTIVTLVNAPAAGGVGSTLRYDVDLEVPHPSNPSVTPLEIPELEVLEMQLNSFGVEAILDRDVLASCVLIYDGVGNSFTLTY
jgi:hypothetical protein